MAEYTGGVGGGQVCDGPFFAKQDHVWVRRSSPVVTNSGVPLVVPWNEIVEQEGTMFALAAPTDIVIRRIGLYALCAALEWDLPALNGNIRAVFLRRVRGAEVRDISGTAAAPVPTASGFTTIVNVATCLPCRAGDIFRVTGLQDVGANLNILGSANEFGFSMFQAMKVA